MKKIIKIARENNCGIKLEKLTNINKIKEKKSKKSRKSFRSTLNSWSYSQLGNMIFYKAQLQGIPVHYVDPKFTSQRCSRCGKVNKRNRKGKKFKCVDVNCKHIDHADANAAFGIALAPKLVDPNETEIIRNESTDTSIEQRNVNLSENVYTFSEAIDTTLEPPQL